MYILVIVLVCVTEVDDEMGGHTGKRGGNHYFSLPDHTPVIFRSLSCPTWSLVLLVLTFSDTKVTRGPSTLPGDDPFPRAH